MENDGARYARIKFGTSCRSIILNSPLSILNYCYLFSSANFFMKSMSFSTPSIGIAL